MERPGGMDRRWLEFGFEGRQARPGEGSGIFLSKA